jgi:hypothetical protein
MLRDPSWVKSRIYARLILRHQSGRFSARDRRLAEQLRIDPGVTNRLIDQAVASLCASKKLSYSAIVEQFHDSSHQLADSRRSIA